MLPFKQEFGTRPIRTQFFSYKTLASKAGEYFIKTLQTRSQLPYEASATITRLQRNNLLL